MWMKVQCVLRELNHVFIFVSVDTILPVATGNHDAWCGSFLYGIEVKLREMIDYECRKLFHFSFEIAIINAEI